MDWYQNPEPHFEMEHDVQWLGLGAQHSYAQLFVKDNSTTSIVGAHERRGRGICGQLDNIFGQLIIRG